MEMMKAAACRRLLHVCVYFSFCGCMAQVGRWLCLEGAAVFVVALPPIFCNFPSFPTFQSPIRLCKTSHPSIPLLCTFTS